ncbi:MAG TPA: DUF4215 domain-containing protein [Polyangiaceae bacterium]|nr:DUF4215 domain-containing protein [Polyangiaceae bacterium]
MRRPLLALCLAPLLAALAGSCAEGEPRVGTSCTPNQRTFCRCPDGEGGTQLCAADGRSFGECGPCAATSPGGDDDDDLPITGARPVCGNQIVEPGEQCDDGNDDDGDECSSLCQRGRPGGPAPGEAADACDGAAPASLNVGVEFQSRQGLAAAGADLLGSCGGDAAELVFGLTPTITGRLELSLRPDDPALDVVLYVRRGACTDPASEPAGGCQNAAAAGGEEALSLPVEAGTSYFVFADAQGALAGAAPFTLTARVNPTEPCQGEGTACLTGLPGACADGTLRCVEGQFLVCRSEQGSAQEACGDGVDNDCDGDTDEGCPCAHDRCATGGQLDPSCTVGGAADPCIQAICAADPFCCDPVAEPDGLWDLACVNQVYFVCGSLTCEAHEGACAHSVCEEGAPLQPGCDDDIACVSKLCAADPFCCGAGGGIWDEFCVAKVTEFCGIDGQGEACSN